MGREILDVYMKIFAVWDLGMFSNRISVHSYLLNNQSINHAVHGYNYLGESKINLNYQAEYLIILMCNI